jgi:hypothetical protein
MTTKSAVAQMIVAEYARGQSGSGGVNESNQGESRSVFDRHPDGWYRPDGKYDFAVYVPDDAGVHDEGKTRYYKTRDGAAKALQRWYE